MNLKPAGFGRWKCTHRERGKIVPFGRFVVPNVRTIVGANLMNDVMFHGTAAVATWYCGLIADSATVEVSQNDIMSSHAGWTELTTYDEATRVAWVEGASAGGITTGAVMVFTFSASGALRGMFITSVDTKGGTTGTLYSAGLESMPRLVIDNQTIDMEYESSLVDVA